MNIRRFSAKDSRAAMLLVREELGPEAVILANRQVPGGVEILAARDLDASLDRVEEAAATSASAPQSGVNELALLQLQRELASLRSLLESELAARGWSGADTGSVAQPLLRQRLMRMGLSRLVVSSMIEALPGQGAPERQWRRLLRMLVRDLPVIPSYVSEGWKVVALLGTTGVGKTAAIAKLVARDARAGDLARTAVLAFDPYDAGIGDRLLHITAGSGLAVTTVKDGAALQQALDHYDYCDRVYIDTVGFGQRDPRLLEQFETLHRTRPDAALLTVVSASSNAVQARELLLRFGRSRLSGAIISKLDEAVVLGPFLDVLLRTAVPVAYSFGGQGPASAIDAAQPQQLVRLAERLRQTRAGGRRNRDVMESTLAVSA